MIKDCVNIVLVNYNGYQDTIECVDSIFKSTYTMFNVIVVDNDSTNDSASELTKYFENNYENYYSIGYDYYQKRFQSRQISIKQYTNNIILIESNKNGGFGYANNIGFNFSKSFLDAEFCWILNNDVSIEKDALETLVTFIKNQDEKVFIGSTIIEYYDKTVIGRLAGNMYYPLLGYIKPYNAGKKVEQINTLKAKFNYLSGCSIFTYFSNIYLIKGFDEKFFLYAEDIDICKRAQKNDIKLLWCKDSFIYHKGGSSIGTANVKRKRSAFSEYHSNLSIIIYNKKWYKLASLYNTNRYILKCIKFIKDKDFEMFKPLNEAYRDYKHSKRR